ncbi:hypothetical protein [Actinomadura sp. WMMA1423]|uniref:hypothetical protein n=1 Tax=Actinomadura sp. WMMA1423 TaxID=2591108 RepID=UPI00197A7305|nr:hypothetical protein [Actinomadura sp. WMMA1423]
MVRRRSLLTTGPFIRLLNKLTTQAATSIELREYPEPARSAALQGYTPAGVPS